MNSPNLGSRFDKIIQLIEAQKVDGLLLNTEADVSYAAGFHAPDSYLIASRRKLTIITDFRYSADFLKKAEPEVTVVEIKNNCFKSICDAIKKEALKTIGFQSRYLSFAECQELLKISKKSITWIPLKETVEPLRAIKDAQELSKIRKAIQITLSTYDFIKKKLHAGMTELQASAEIERFIRLQGATSSAFETIVASGPNSSYPHAQVSNRAIKNGEPVIIDLGVNYDGYKCDLTRTFFLGRINPIVREIESIVREAQRHAISLIKPGTSIKNVDAAARNYIEKKGFGKNFGHSLGHGVGLEVHEAPSINKKSELKLKEGMVFTIEPGIYLAGSFGIRIEDMVLVTNNGVEVLSVNSWHKSG